MGYTIRQMDHERNFCRELTVEALQRAVPPEAIHAVLRETGSPVRRARKLTAEATIWVLIALNVYTHLAVGHVLRKVSQGLRFIWPDPTYRVPGASAFVYRRYQLGAAPVVALYERLARPIATVQTPGAFRFGLRLMALDGTVEDVPDSPANAAAFGRQHGSRGDSACPQVQGVYLVEWGTHAIVDATFGPLALNSSAPSRTTNVSSSRRCRCDGGSLFGRTSASSSAKAPPVCSPAMQDGQEGTTSCSYVTVVRHVDRRPSGRLKRADGGCDTSCACLE